MINLPDWVVDNAASVLTFAGIVLTGLGALLGSVLASRVQKRNADAAMTDAITHQENALIDQLQEELKRYRDASDRRSTAQDERMNRLERLSDGYRDYAHQLRSHIFDRKQPPPPEWPDGLPR